MTSWLNAIAVPLDQAIWVLLSVCLAALMRAFTGFGFAMLAVPVFSLFLLPGDAVVLSAALACCIIALDALSMFACCPLMPCIPACCPARALPIWLFEAFCPYMPIACPYAGLLELAPSMLTALLIDV